MTIDDRSPNNTHSKAELLAFYERLKELKASCGPNKHDQADVCIIACIEFDINQKSGIIGALLHANFNRGHVARRLEAGNRHFWRIDPEGRYHVLPLLEGAPG